MPASLDGAILAKMADRRQIVGGIVDGPLDLDAAVDLDVRDAPLRQVVLLAPAGFWVSNLTGDSVEDYNAAPSAASSAP